MAAVSGETGRIRGMQSYRQHFNSAFKHKFYLSYLIISDVNFYKTEF
jgi:hypothetical protein